MKELFVKDFKISRIGYWVKRHFDCYITELHCAMDDIIPGILTFFKVVYSFFETLFHIIIAPFIGGFLMTLSEKRAKEVKVREIKEKNEGSKTCVSNVQRSN